MRILKTNLLISLVKGYLVDSPQPSNLSYLWNFGSLLGFCLVIQIVTGVTLAMHYNPSVLEGFNSVEHIMRDVNNGWLIRYLYSNTASAFFFLVYLHIGKRLYCMSLRTFLTVYLYVYWEEILLFVQSFFLACALFNSLGLEWPYLLLGGENGGSDNSDPSTNYSSGQTPGQSPNPERPQGDTGIAAGGGLPRDNTSSTLDEYVGQYLDDEFLSTYNSGTGGDTNSSSDSNTGGNTNSSSHSNTKGDTNSSSHSNTGGDTNSSSCSPPNQGLSRDTSKVSMGTLERNLDEATRLGNIKETDRKTSGTIIIGKGF